MDFQDVEGLERAFDLGHAAAEREQGVVDAGRADRADIQTAPVSGAGRLRCAVTVGVERPSRSVTGRPNAM